MAVATYYGRQPFFRRWTPTPGTARLNSTKGTSRELNSLATTAFFNFKLKKAMVSSEFRFLDYSLWKAVGPCGVQKAFLWVTRMPFARRKALSTFQRPIDVILSFLKFRLALQYSDDIAVFSKHPQETYVISVTRSSTSRDSVVAFNVNSARSLSRTLFTTGLLFSSSD